MPVQMKRAYEEFSKEDGVRILVDGIWPRGVSKEELQLDHWLKDVAPSKELRQWFNHDADKFDEFKTKYKEELRSDDEKEKELEKLKDIVSKNKKDVTLVYGAKDDKHNQAAVLKEIVDQQRV